MKSNTKSLYSIIVVLLLIIIVGAWYALSSDKKLKEKNKKLFEQIETIQSQRDSLAKERVILESKYDSVEVLVTKEQEKLLQIESDLKKSEKNLKDAKFALKKYKDEYDAIDKKINALHQNSIKRTGQDLLLSLEKKVK